MTNTTQHTQGPWFSEPYYIADQLGGFAIYAGGKHASIGRCDTGHDARLIAAAPELLEALKALLNDYQNVRQANDWLMNDNIYVREAYDAIAKAKGE